MNQINTREEWLRAAALELDRLLLQRHGTRLPAKFHVSFGFPRGSMTAIGQAWGEQQEHHHMFVSPRLSDAVHILGVLLHECIHIAVGVKEKHGGEFKRVARACGLEGKLTATYVKEGSELDGALRGIAERLGALNHTALEPRSTREPKGGGGWVRLYSRSIKGYTVVVSPKMLDEYGPPLDPEGEPMGPKED